MSKDSKKDDFEDDGRTIADMSGIEGPGLFGRPDLVTRKKKQEKKDKTATQEEQIGKSERRSYILGSVSAAIVVGLIFIAVLGLAVLLMLILWN
ncbi:MAG: hypothetical protein ACOX6J_00150 [Oscillospiraceae bacterium]|jgi:hypothetical protein